jgi:RNA polymerase sigma-70 factor (ECF subfamily)
MADLGPSAADQADRDDLARVRRGDDAAFGRLYARHAGRVSALARWMVGREDAASATQDVFVRVWEQAGAFRGESTFATWLHRLAVNVLLRFRERRGRDESRGGELELLDSHEARGAEPGVRLDLAAAVDALTPRLRDVFVLHDVMGFRAAEIAEQLGIAELTVRSHVARARSALRDRLRDDGDGGR